MIIYVPNSQIQFEMNESMFNVALQHNSPLRPRTFQSNKQFAALNCHFPGKKIIDWGQFMIIYLADKSNIQMENE